MNSVVSDQAVVAASPVGQGEPGAVAEPANCCSPVKQASCCEPSEKASCCGKSAASGSCGCQ